MARFSPPGRVTDLTTEEQLQAWSDNVVTPTVGDAIANLETAIGAENVQLVNPLVRPIPNARRRKIPWFTFAQDLWDVSLRDAARIHADNPGNRVPSFQGQNEYSEWFTHRDSAGRVTAVDLTTELPEYWDFLVATLPKADIVAIYQTWVDPAANEAAIFNGAGGAYNPQNEFNTIRGAMHMINDINTLTAAVGLISTATIWRFSGSDPVDVQDCQGGSHHADPTVIAHFNRLAREGRYITLEDPIGVYILGIDTDGWTTPDGSPAEDLVQYVRGTPPVRARVAVPPGRGFQLSDVTIGGEPIQWGSQIAERTTVGVIASVGRPGEIRPTNGRPCTGGIAPVATAEVAAIAEDLPYFFGRGR